MTYLTPVVSRMSGKAPVIDHAKPRRPLDAEEVLRIMNVLSAPDMTTSDRTLKELAFRTGRTASHLGRRFSQLAGLNFRALSRVKRDHLSCDLLKTTDLAIKEIAALTGYCAVSDFCHSFRRHHGLSPGKYRESSRKGTA